MALRDLLITSVRIHSVACDLSERFGWSLSWTKRRATTLVEVTTADGITGWGEGTWGGESLLANPSLVIGRSAFEIEGIHESLRAPSRNQRRRGAPCSAGLDIALWDIAGKALGKPVCRLLGHVYRTGVEAYCTALYRKDWPDLAQGLAAEAVEWKRAGYRNLKMKIGYDPSTDVRVVAAVREAIGPGIGLGVDSNCAYDAGTAVQLARRLEPFDLLWWEEPLTADDLEGYARLKRATSIPIAAGESENADWLLANYVQPKIVDILQPDPEWVGFTGMRRLSHACWINRIRLIPHNWGTAIRTAAALHSMAVCPPLTEALNPPPLLFEFDRTENPMRDAVIAEKIDIEPADALVGVPMSPGLGISVLPEAVERFRVNLQSIC
jgi:D-galactarolactone cycloisomerase